MVPNFIRKNAIRASLPRMIFLSHICSLFPCPCSLLFVLMPSVNLLKLPAFIEYIKLHTL